MSTHVERAALRENRIPTGLVLVLAVVAVVAWTLIRDDSAPIKLQPSPAHREVEEAKIPIARVIGSYYHEDGLRGITIKEVFAEDGWNGQLIFTPGVGDWAKPVRCRISGSTVLAVEIPAPDGRLVVSMFTLRDPRTIIGEVKPWEGVYRR